MKTKITLIFSTLLLLALGGYIYFKFYFPVASEAVKSGELNYIMYKGYIWKTYEGKLIQAGINSNAKRGNTGVQSNEFDFSVVDKEIAEQLMKNSGRVMSLRYKQYNGALPWRGMQRNIVYAIDHIEPRVNSLQDVPLNEIDAAVGGAYAE